jgi:hypothetical protein
MESTGSRQPIRGASDRRPYARAVPDQDKAKIRQLAYELSQRRLDHQRDDLERIRQRSSSELTLASAAAALLAGAGFAGVGDGHFTADWRLWVGIVMLAFIAGVHAVTTFAANWRFHQDASVILEGYADAGRSIDVTHHWLAWFNAEDAQTNDKRLNRLSLWVSVAAVALVLEVASLAWFLASNV